MKNEKYLARIRENFPGDEAYVVSLWDEKEKLQARITEIEKELLKYGPPSDEPYISPQSVERQKALNEFKAGMKPLSKADADKLEKE